MERKMYADGSVPGAAAKDHRLVAMTGVVVEWATYHYHYYHPRVGGTTGAVAAGEAGPGGSTPSK